VEIVSPWSRRGLCVLLLSAAGCAPDVFGPDTETGPALRTGRVTNEAGDPVVGARVFWSYPGWIVGDGPVLVPDSAIADASGHYRLETEHYCNSQLSARAEGYEPVNTNLSYLACPDDQPVAVDIVLVAESVPRVVEGP
jgi:hypothetical protein